MRHPRQLPPFLFGLAGVLTLVLLVAGGCDRGKAGPTAGSAATVKPTCLVLEHPGIVLDVKEVYQPMPLIARELLRQALLISARDELGIATRDPVLRESGGPPAKPDPVLRLALAHSLSDKQVGYSIRWQNGTTWAVVKEGTVPFVREGVWDYLPLIEQAERLSRTEFPDTLRQAGFVAEPRAAANDEPLPEDVETLLWSVNTIDQYSAVRKLHDLMRTRGESRQILGGLARGYANLGVLAEMHWNVSHKAFKARGLLYAQRCLVRDSGRAFGRAHRAYAVALAGRHADGLAEVAAVRKQKAGARAATAPATAPATRPTGTELAAPAWLDMVEATCSVDCDKLMEIFAQQEPFAGWAGLLRVLQLDSGHLSTAEGEVIMRVVSEHPNCLRALSMLNRSGQLGHVHAAGPAALEELDNALREQLPEVPGLPDNLRKMIDAMQDLSDTERGASAPAQASDRAALIRQLVTAGEPRKDKGEPSLTVLGHLIEEEFFDHVQERAYFLGRKMAIDAAPFVDWALNVVPDHPYRGYLEGYRYPRGRGPRDALVNIRSIRTVDLDDQMSPVFNWFDYYIKNSGRQTASAGMRCNMGRDMVVRDLLRDIEDYQTDRHKLYAAHHLVLVSPRHLVAACTLIELDWKAAEPFLARWDQIHGRKPEYVKALAKHYYDHGPLTLAEATLKKVIDMQPAVWAYLWLAKIYERWGDDDKYVRTLEAGLTAPDAGLGNSEVAIWLADHYRRKRDWDNALAYASQAAQSCSGASMRCMARCYEAKGDLEQAEEWMKRLADRYPDDSYKWYIWCRINRHGDVKSAQKAAEACFRGRDFLNTWDFMGPYYAFYLTVADQLEKALNMYQQIFDRYHIPLYGLYAATLAEQIGRPELRDRFLKDVIEKGPQYKSDGKPMTESIELARMFQETLAGGPPLDDQAIAKLMKTRADSDTEIPYFVGRFLEKRDPARAREYLRRAARSERNIEATSLARYRLVQLGIPLDTQPASGPASSQASE